MFRHIKYDLRRDLSLYIILFSILFLLEAYVVYAILSENEIHLGISAVLFVLGAFGGIVFIMIMGAVSYGKLINSKSSYMAFMTPCSAKQIVGAKYIALFSATAIASVIYVAFIYMDVKLIFLKYSDIKDTTEMINELLGMMGISVADILISLAASLLQIWIYIFSVLSCAFFGVTLSATLLANKKGKGWLSFGFFLVLFIVTRIIIAHLPNFDFGTEFIQIVAGQWLIYLFQILMIVGSFVGSTLLLDKKVSL